jgi:hypothetical protein
MPLFGFSEHGFNPNGALTLSLVVGRGGVILSNTVQDILMDGADHDTR